MGTWVDACGAFTTNCADLTNGNLGWVLGLGAGVVFLPSAATNLANLANGDESFALVDACGARQNGQNFSEFTECLGWVLGLCAGVVCWGCVLGLMAAALYYGLHEFNELRFGLMPAGAGQNLQIAGDVVFGLGAGLW